MLKAVDKEFSLLHTLLMLAKDKLEVPTTLMDPPMVQTMMDALERELIRPIDDDAEKFQYRLTNAGKAELGLMFVTGRGSAPVAAEKPKVTPGVRGHLRLVGGTLVDRPSDNDVRTAAPPPSPAPVPPPAPPSRPRRRKKAPDPARTQAAAKGWEHRRERDEFAAVNIPTPLLPLWEKEKGRFTGTPDERSRAFLEYAELHPGDAAVALLDVASVKLDVELAKQVGDLPPAKKVAVIDAEIAALEAERAAIQQEE